MNRFSVHEIEIAAIIPLISLTRNRPNKRHLQGIKSSLNMYGKLQGFFGRIIAFAPPHGIFLQVDILC